MKPALVALPIRRTRDGNFDMLGFRPWYARAVGSDWSARSRGGAMENKIMSGGIIALVLALSCTNATAGPNRSETEIRELISRWDATFRARDLDGVMAVYAPGTEFVAFDVSPPLQCSGREAYRESYRTFFAQYDGPLTVEYRDVKIGNGGNIALYHAPNRHFEVRREIVGLGPRDLRTAEDRRCMANHPRSFIGARRL